MAQSLDYTGFSGDHAVMLTYACGFLLGALLFQPRAGRNRLPWLLAALGLSAAWYHTSTVITRNQSTTAHDAPPLR